MTAKEDFEKRIRSSYWTGNRVATGCYLSDDAVKGLKQIAEETYGELNLTVARHNAALVREKADLRTEMTAMNLRLEAEEHNGDSLRKQLDQVTELLGKCVKCGLHLIDQRAEKSSEIERLQNLLEAAAEAGENLIKRLEDKTAECEYVTGQINRLSVNVGLPEKIDDPYSAEEIADAVEKTLAEKSGKKRVMLRAFSDDGPIGQLVVAV